MNILIVDDEPDLAESLALLLTERGHTCTPTTDPVEALALCRRTPFDLLLTDYAMPGMNGQELAEAVRRTRPEVAIIMFTAYGNTFYQREERELEIDAVIQKPADTNRIESVIQRVMRERKAGSKKP